MPPWALPATSGRRRKRPANGPAAAACRKPESPGRGRHRWLAGANPTPRPPAEPPTEAARHACPGRPPGGSRQ
eukprot:7382706-Lingulodinium_polyedra.AAC.1